MANEKKTSGRKRKTSNLGVIGSFGKGIHDTIQAVGTTFTGGKRKKPLGNTTSVTPTFTADRVLVYLVGGVVIVGGILLVKELTQIGLDTIKKGQNTNSNESQKLIASGQALPPVPKDILVIDGGTQPSTLGEYVIKVKKGLKLLNLYNGAEDATWAVNSEVDNALRNYADQNGLADKTTTATRTGTYSIVDWYRAIQTTLKGRGITFAGFGGLYLSNPLAGLGCGCNY